MLAEKKQRIKDVGEYPLLWWTEQRHVGKNKKQENNALYTDFYLSEKESVI